MLLTSVKCNATFVENLLHSLQAEFRNTKMQKGILGVKNRTRTRRSEVIDDN